MLDLLLCKKLLSLALLMYHLRLLQMWCGGCYKRGPVWLSDWIKLLLLQLLLLLLRVHILDGLLVDSWDTDHSSLLWLLMLLLDNRLRRS